MGGGFAKCMRQTGAVDGPREETTIRTHVLSISSPTSGSRALATGNNRGIRGRNRHTGQGDEHDEHIGVSRTASWKRANITVRTKVIRTPGKGSTGPLGIEHTPIGGEKDVYKYYCPVCMLHFRDVLETGCCKNYVCYSCALAFVRGKGGLKPDLPAIPVELPPIPCMHCGTQGLKLIYVDTSAKPRQYVDSPDTKSALDKAGLYGNGTSPGKVLSFEDESSLLNPVLEDHHDTATTSPRSPVLSNQGDEDRPPTSPGSSILPNPAENDTGMQEKSPRQRDAIEDRILGDVVDGELRLFSPLPQHRRVEAIG